MPKAFFTSVLRYLLIATLGFAVHPAMAQIPGLLPAAPAPEQPAPAQESQQVLERLIEVLRDDTAREALLTELEAGLDRSASEPAAPEEASRPGQELRSIGGQVGEWTRDAVQNTARSLNQLWRQLANTPSMFAALRLSELNALQGMVWHIAILALVSYGGLAVVRRALTRPRAGLRQFFARGGWVAKPLALVLELALDIFAALVPYALGYAIAVSALGRPGEIALEHTLYLNAFLLIELVLAVLRAVVSPNESEQRLIHLSDTEARTVTRWGRLLVSLFVFGQMFLLPVLNTSVSAAAGRAISVVLILATLGVATGGILAARRSVRNKLIRLVSGRDTRRALRMPIAYWHVFALVYLLVLAIVALTRSTVQFQAYLWNNAQIALAVLVGFIVLNVIKQVIGKGFALPENLRRRSPELQRQLDAVVPAVLRVVRLVIITIVALFCIHKLGLFDIVAFLEGEFGSQVAGSIITIAMIVAIALIAMVGLNTWIDNQVNPDLAPRTTARTRTLFVLLRNAASITIIVITLMFVLSEVGINIAPLLASAGVIGLAIGFGAQKLVQDLINGIFIQLEGAIDVGDVVSIGGISGVVERLTIRSAALRDVEGSYHIIPFSSVDTVTNFMRGFSYALIDMKVSYREDADYVKQAMFDAFDRLKADPQFKASVIGDFEWMGVNAFAPSEVIFRGRIKTLPGQQWGIKRAYNGIIKQMFDERGIEIPYPHQTLYFGEDKTGSAPPIRVLAQEAGDTTQGQGTAPAPVRQTDDGIEVPPPARARRIRRPARDTAPIPNQLPDVDAGPDDR
ncbi:MAG TPA: mechanosensitive ion channel domain-containing protein [Pelagibacterium sp.]|uniref:mechanosensitive ion channel domain-containing protein n=1 Tax=Pelagibacterium sp. TaxID=1967288 RepID=UPI002B71A916|nr:mechanosensitive ion channel domain-containing protein [Pelagibacterium sp.]HWJ89301.1 mechanosensitive ion channel domain-containing protein [Pelagibacterium sp.]